MMISQPAWWCLEATVQRLLRRTVVEPGAETVPDPPRAPSTMSVLPESRTVPPEWLSAPREWRSAPWQPWRPVSFPVPRGNRRWIRGPRREAEPRETVRRRGVESAGTGEGGVRSSSDHQERVLNGSTHGVHFGV